MKGKVLLLICALSALLLCAGCSEQAPAQTEQPSSGQLYLYGEAHGIDAVYAAELQEWDYFYKEQNMRHLFVELPYYTAEFLNLWLQADNDDILNAVYEDWQGTVTYGTNVRDFYRQIKEAYPETVFHGTDVGHQYDTTGQRFLAYLQAQGLENSETWQLAQECIEQGQNYYANNSDASYRENAMTQNFIREFDKLANQDIMGIYGGAHVWLAETADQNDPQANMAARLQTRYAGALHTTDLSYLGRENVEPLRMDTLTVAGQEFQAAYFGEEDLRAYLEGYRCRRFWRLENAYNSFRDYPTNDDVLPYNNYPMQVETGFVYLVEYETTEGETIQRYYRSDGNTWQGMPTTEGINIEQDIDIEQDIEMK